MKLKPLLILLLICLYNYSFSCDCPPHQKKTMVQIGLKNADLTFYGELIKIDTIEGSYDFRIIELFKGNYNSKIVHGKTLNNNCGITPFKKDLWIVYANLNKDKTISLDYCLPTQTMDIPAGFMPPIPYYNVDGRKITKLDSLSNHIDNLKIRNETLTTFFYQLEQLRAYKASQKIASEKEETEVKIITYSSYILISLITNIILFLILIFVLIKRKKQ